MWCVGGYGEGYGVWVEIVRGVVGVGIDGGGVVRVDGNGEQGRI